ncbi:MAG TPA: hypothetical protein DDX04_05695 [Massilia sp.]|nr:hypothetical protein [Massilia sp.]
MNRFLQHRLLLTILAAGTLGGCAQIAPLLERNPSSNHPKVESRPEPRAESRPRAEARSEASSGREQVALREGIRLYNEGDFNGAIKRLNSNDIRSGAPLGTRTTALKYTAFSYCVTSRPKQCQQAFEKALKIDPTFSLEPGEEGHPLWGPAFERAKRG